MRCASRNRLPRIPTAKTSHKTLAGSSRGAGDSLKPSNNGRQIVGGNLMCLHARRQIVGNRPADFQSLGEKMITRDQFLSCAMKRRLVAMLAMWTCLEDNVFVTFGMHFA